MKITKISIDHQPPGQLPVWRVEYDLPNGHGQMLVPANDTFEARQKVLQNLKADFDKRTIH